MSMHKSLVLKGKFGGHRNVLKRAERIVSLTKEGKLRDDASVFGLPKVRVIVMKAKKKAEEKTEAAAAAPGAVPAAVPGAAPAPAAKGAPTAKSEAGKETKKK